MIDLQTLMHIVLYILIVGGICWLLWWLIGYIGLPEPFNKIIRVIIGLVALLIVVYILLGMLGPPPTLR